MSARSRQSRLIPFLEHTNTLNASQKQLLAEWKCIAERFMQKDFTFPDTTSFYRRCMRFRTVPLLILDQVLRWMEGKSAPMLVLECYAHQVGDDRET